MFYTTLPHTNLRASSLCLGSTGFGSTNTEAESARKLDQFLDAGGTLIDTAHCYSDWEPGERHRSEKVIGRWLKSSGKRDKIVLCTKGGVSFIPGVSITESLDPNTLNAELDDSLRNLGTDHIDLYWLHRDEPARPVAEILEALNERVVKGDVRYIGCSNWKPERMAEAADYARKKGIAAFVAHELEWSLARRLVPETAIDTTLPWMSDAMMDYHRKSGMTAFAFSSQAKGFFQKLDEKGADGVSENLKRAFLTPASAAGWERIRALRENTGMTVTQIMLGYIRGQKDFVGIPIVYGRTEAQMNDILAATDSVLTEDEIRFLLDGRY